MSWARIGRIFSPHRALPWAASHAAVPIAHYLGGDRYRVYFTCRDSDNRSHVAFFEFDPADASRILAVSEEPVLAPGGLGSFDEDGAMASWLVEDGRRLYLYYQGWNRGVTVPFRNAIGLAVSEDRGRTFRRVSTGPILDRGIHDPFFVAGPCVLRDHDGWRMWYSTGRAWTAEAEGPKHYYNIAYASSGDGIDWRRDGTTCVDFASADEYALARACVLRAGSTFQMWFSCRGAAYRIGYAESTDGVHWTRKKPLAGLEPSVDGWDSEMVGYPFVFDHGGRRYMLFNGNGYGRTGIGLAVLVAE